jgi:hypothetical protein
MVMTRTRTTESCSTVMIALLIRSERLSRLYRVANKTETRVMDLPSPYIHYLKVPGRQNRIKKLTLQLSNGL